MSFLFFHCELIPYVGLQVREEFNDHLTCEDAFHFYFIFSFFLEHVLSSHLPAGSISVTYFCKFREKFLKLRQSTTAICCQLNEVNWSRDTRTSHLLTCQFEKKCFLDTFVIYSYLNE